jgi:hypothetical protein
MVMHRALLASAIAFVAATFALDASAQPALPGVEKTPDGISSVRADPSRGRSSVWTDSQLRAAEPVPLPVVDPQAVLAGSGARSAGPPSAGATESGAAPQGPGRRSGNVRNYPQTMVGRLYFNASGDKPGWGHLCTAQFVASNVILTASHCVQDDKPPYAYHSNYLFSLQYEQGAASKKYGWKCQANMTGWAQPNDGRYLWDYAMIMTDAPSEVGWFGLQWNWSGKYNRATKIGYPSGSFKGEIIQVDPGPIVLKDRLVEMHHGNKDIQHGSSGGAYVGDYSTTFANNANHLISSESFSLGEAGETSGVSYGPYYTDDIFKLYNYTKAGCRNP